MDAASTLDTVDHDATVVSIARRFLGHDSRVRFHVSDGAAFLASLAGRQFDLIFADTWPGKFTHLEDALSLLRPGGIYVGDDLLPSRLGPRDTHRRFLSFSTRSNSVPIFTSPAFRGPLNWS
jgi:predicted O-methyltransferase YrrM